MLQSMTFLDTLFLMTLIITKGKWLLVTFLLLWYNIQRCRTQSGNRKGVYYLDLIISFLVSVMAGVASYYICKWLDGDDSDN